MLKAISKAHAREREKNRQRLGQWFMNRTVAFREEMAFRIAQIHKGMVFEFSTGQWVEGIPVQYPAQEQLDLLYSHEEANSF